MNKKPQTGTPLPLNFAPTSETLLSNIKIWIWKFELRGTSTLYETRENARIRLLNRLYLGIIPLLVSVFLIDLFFSKHSIGAFLVGLALLFYLGAMSLSGRGKHAMARWIAVLPIILILDTLTIYFGRSSGGSISFLVIGLGIVILFRSRQSIMILLGLLLLSFAGTEWYLYHYEPLIQAVDYLILVPPLIFTSNFVVMVGIILYFEELIVSSRKERSRLLVVLQEKNRSLSQTNYELAHFAKTASYHFKAPLKNISNILGLLERKIPESSPQSVKTYVDLVKGNSAHLYRLVEDILMYSNVDELTKADGEIETPISGVLDNIILNIQSFIVENNAQVILEEDFLVPMAAPHLELLLQNFIQNGIKYNQSEHKRVIIRKRESEQKGLLTFEIVDNGIGIAPEYHENIFGMFSRLYSNDEYEGTGIGLAVCRKILHLYRGSVLIDSDMGKGSAFILTIPLP